jgi:hypothetical protein
MRLPVLVDACAVLLTSAAICAQQPVHDHPEQQSAFTSFQPFYLEQTQGLANASGTGVWIAQASLFVTARRADGTTVRIESRGPDSIHRLRMRDVFFADGRTVTAYDTLKLKTTWSDGHGLVGDRIEDDSADCTRQSLDEFGRPIERTNDLQSVEGQLVVVSTQTSGGFAFTRWRAPQLACEELYYRAEKLKEGAVPAITVEKKTTKLVLGDPDPELFTIDSGFAETPPSKALLNVLLGMGLPISDEERQRIVKEGEELDRRYRSDKR